MFLLMIHFVWFLGFRNSYVRGFKSGFDKAWDVMTPMLSETISKAKESIRASAVEETRKLMGPLINGNKLRKDK